MAQSRFSLNYIRRLCTSAAPTTVETQSSGPISVSKAKTRLRKVHDPDKALAIYSSVFNHEDSPVSSRYAQELTVLRLAKCHRFSDIECLIESHKNDPKIKEEAFLSTLIRSYGRASMFDHAMKTFEQMEEFGTPRSAISFNALLSACIHSGKFENVPQLFDEIPQRYKNIIPDKISYGILIKSYCNSGSPEKAMEIMKQMESKGIEFTTIAFTTILASLYKNSKIELAENLWSEMLKKGCEIDNAVYNVRIMNASKVSPERVMELIEEMSSLGLKPDTISYNYLMTAYCEKGKMEEAKKVYEGLGKNCCSPNAATFRTLIFHLCLNGLYEQGYGVFKKSVNMHKIPDFNTLKCLVEGLVKRKKIDDAKGLGRTVKKKFSPSFLNDWKKLEEELGLYSSKKTNSGESSLESSLESDKTEEIAT